MKGWGSKFVKKNKIIGEDKERYPMFKKMLSDRFGVPETEFKFHPTRRWKFDYCYPDKMVGIEVEGLVYGGGISRHTNNEGYKGDIEKYNAAACLNWIVLRFTPDMLNKQETFDTISQAFSLRN